jgi:hypothetical protein
MRHLTVPLALVLALAWTGPARADGLDAELAHRRARNIRITAAGAGALVGAGLGLSIVTGPDLFHSGADPRVVRWVQVSGVGIQTLSSTWATWWFADVQLRKRRGPWRSLGWGVLYGMAAGAMSFGTGFGSTLTLGWLTDTIRVGESVDRWWKIIPMNYGVSSAMGGFTCIPVGLLASPAISLTMRF